jgi:hypothetical protein
MALDAPDRRDVVLHEAEGLTIVASRFDANKLGDVVIEWYGDERSGFLAARPAACALR